MAMADRKFPNPRPIVPPRVCRQCEHDLTGLPLTEPCPACGWTPSIHCVSCGYDLTGLPAHGPCPECATPIAESIRGDGLAFASVEHLERLHMGLGYTRLGIGLVVCVWILAIVAQIVVSMLTASGPPSWLGDAILLGPLVGCTALWTLGWWKVTTPDPRLEGREDARAPLAARWLAVAVLLVVIATLVLVPLVPAPVPGLGLSLVVLLILQYAAGSVCLSRLALQAGNRRATKYARFVQIAAAIFAVCLVGTIVKRSTAYQPPAGSLPKLVMSIGSIALFVSGLAMVFQQSNAAGLLRDDLHRFLFHARHRK
jgi:hypothetical protein